MSFERRFGEYLRPVLIYEGTTNPSFGTFPNPANIQKPDGSYVLIEIENPRAELFTKAGEFSAAVNHALRQVEDWQEWIEANLPTVERYYPGIRSPEAWVIIGRDSGLANPERRRLARRNVNMRGRVAVKTYDDVLRDAKAYVHALARALGGG